MTIEPPSAGPAAASMTIEPLPPAERTLPAMLGRGAARHGERPLLGFGAASWSHRDLPRLA
ncbi:MAG: hypothetical protein ACXWIQ_08440, partial [Caldimonas sp.]